MQRVRGHLSLPPSALNTTPSRPHKEPDQIQAGRFASPEREAECPGSLSSLSLSRGSPIPSASPKTAESRRRRRRCSSPRKPGEGTVRAQLLPDHSHGGGIGWREEHRLHGVPPGPRPVREAGQQGAEQQWRGPGLGLEPDLAAGLEGPQVQPAAGRPRPRRRPHRRRRLPALRRQGLVPRLHPAVPRAGAPAEAGGGGVRERREGRRHRPGRGLRGVHLRHRARRQPADDAHPRRRDDGGARVRRHGPVRECRVHRRALRRPAVWAAAGIVCWRRVRPLPLLHEAAVGEHGHLYLQGREGVLQQRVPGGVHRGRDRGCAGCHDAGLWQLDGVLSWRRLVVVAGAIFAQIEEPASVCHMFRLVI